MDINLLRSLVTLAAFIMFIGILVWAWMPSRKDQFEDAAQLPFRAEEEPRFRAEQELRFRTEQEPRHE